MDDLDTKFVCFEMNLPVEITNKEWETAAAVETLVGGSRIQEHKERADVQEVYVHLTLINLLLVRVNSFMSLHNKWRQGLWHSLYTLENGQHVFWTWCVADIRKRKHACFLSIEGFEVGRDELKINWFHLILLMCVLIYNQSRCN